MVDIVVRPRFRMANRMPPEKSFMEQEPLDRLIRRKQLLVDFEEIFG